ncbi:Protein of unknown function [Cotesia congregata]|uniref:HTH psq-type domain-containing protein n=1 Tax=Cotesia congregata TaxID=51543 RepID=A0A8J2MWE7_COTCN|nr:Protein of unknown function [Cotesia congregata]
MAKAIQEVVNGTMGLKTAAKSYNVPRSTLQRRIKVFKVNSDLESSIEKRSIETVFSPTQEEELVKYLKQQESRLSGLTTKELRLLAYQLAEKNGRVKPTKDKPVLLILDGHTSHTQNLKVIDYAKKHHLRHEDQCNS